jgi:hypothetical protein
MSIKLVGSVSLVLVLLQQVKLRCVVPCLQKKGHPSQPPGRIGQAASQLVLAAGVRCLAIVSHSALYFSANSSSNLFLLCQLSTQ